MEMVNRTQIKKDTPNVFFVDLRLCPATDSDEPSYPRFVKLISR
jgi:hypothetical protein